MRGYSHMKMATKDFYITTGETYGPADSLIYMKNGKKYIKITSGKDNRFLLLPDHGINIQCMEMIQEDWNRLVEKTRIPTMEQRQVLRNEYLKGRMKNQDEVLKRKREMQKALAPPKLTTLEKEKEYEKTYAIERANQLLLDEEDSMKEFNRMIALKKCLATWDLQILEKAKIQSEIKEEKLLQEREVEKIRRECVKENEQKKQNENKDKQNFIKALGEQIKEREIAMKLALQKKQLERNKFNRAAKQAEVDELKEFQQKIKDDEKLREEQRRVNVLLQRLQAIDREEDRLFQEKSQETTREMQKEIEDKESHKKEIEMKRKAELQKMADEKLKAEERAKFNDLMEEILRMDNVERVWRQRELLEQQEKYRRLQEMYTELEKQVENRRIAKAQIIEEERREVCKVAKDNIEDEMKDREVERKIKLANEAHRMEILLQINDIDRRKLANREDKILENNFYKIQEERRVDHTKEGMWKRLEQVKNDRLPEKYVQDLKVFVKKKYGPKTS